MYAVTAAVTSRLNPNLDVKYVNLDKNEGENTTKVG